MKDLFKGPHTHRVYENMSLPVKSIPISVKPKSRVRNYVKIKDIVPSPLCGLHILALTFEPYSKPALLLMLCFMGKASIDA